MLLCSNAKWWGDFGIRKSCHEGLDIGMYKNLDNKIVWVRPEVIVPAMAQGTVVNVCHDFLGKSVIVLYRHCPENNSRFVIIYSHIQPFSDIRKGKILRKDEPLGQIADTAGKKSKIPCHLHVSTMEIVNTIDNSRLNWDLFTSPAPPGVNLYNPWMFNAKD